MKNIVALSGGKDSTALAIRLRELNPDTDYEYIITPTGNEPQEMFDHWRNLESLLGKPLTNLQVYPGNGLRQVSIDEKMIPNWRARFCTRILKIEPAIKYLSDNTPCIHYVGLRADEPDRVGIYDDVPGVTHSYPMREWGWTINDVWDYLDSKNITIPHRTDCEWCFFQRLPEWKILWQERPESYQSAIDLEDEIGATFRSNGRDSFAPDLRTLAKQFVDGKKIRGEKQFMQKRLQQRLLNCDAESICRICTM